MLQVAPSLTEMAPPWCEIEGGKAKVSIQILLCPEQEHIAGARHFSPELTGWYGVRSLFGHPRSISSPAVQIHVERVEGKRGSGACGLKGALLNPTYVPGQGYSKSARQLRCCTTYGSAGLVASEVGQCDMQSPFVVDRSALAAVHGGS
jgi:hypothetical protein